MIEVEVKIPLAGDAKERLIKGAQYVMTIKMEDTYYDTSDYKLSTQDTWLRKRNGAFELKIPKHEEKSISRRTIDQYEELDTEEAIREFLQLREKTSLEDDLKKSGFKPFGKIVSTREKYTNGELKIDVDTMDFGDELAEVELMVNEQSEAKAAKEKIIHFAKDRDLHFSGQADGKVIKYIKKNKPDQYQALVAAGVLDE